MDCLDIKSYYIEICKGVHFKKNPEKTNNMFKLDKNKHCIDMIHFYDLYCNSSPKDIKPSNR